MITQSVLKRIKWPVLEGLARTTSSTLVKAVGNFAGTAPFVFFSSALIGLVQVVSALSYLRFKRVSIFEESKPGDISGALAFGVFALVNTALGFFAFAAGAPLVLHIFFMTLSIIPGAFLDRMFFRERLFFVQWIGIAISIVATWLILDGPMPEDLTSMSSWLIYSIVTPFTMAINQGITRRIQSIQPMVKNFWGGLVALVLGLAAIPLLGTFTDVFASDHLSKLIWLSIAIGLTVVVMWIFNVIAYREKGMGIALKKLITNASWLTFSLIVGYFFFGDTVTLLQIGGVLLFFLAFVFLDKETWGELKQILGFHEQDTKPQN